MKTLILTISLITLSGCAYNDAGAGRLAPYNCPPEYPNLSCVMTGEWVKKNSDTFAQDRKQCTELSRIKLWNPVTRYSGSCSGDRCTGTSTSGYSSSNHISAEKYQACMAQRGHERGCSNSNECARHESVRSSWLTK